MNTQSSTITHLLNALRSTQERYFNKNSFSKRPLSNQEEKEFWFKKFKDVKSQVERSIGFGVPASIVEKSLLYLEELRKELLEHKDKSGFFIESFPLVLFMHSYNLQVASFYLKIKCETPFIFGTLPTGSINAQCLPPLEKPGRVVIIDDGTFIFSYLIARCIARCVPITGQKANGEYIYSFNVDGVISQMLDNQSKTVKRYVEIIGTYLKEGTPFSASQFKGDKEWEFLEFVIRDGIELFILGHEYAHIINGRKPIMITNEKEEKNGFGSAWDSALSQFDEFSADELGAQLVVEVFRLRGIPSKLALLGPLVFLHALKHFEQLKFILKGEGMERGLTAYKHHYSEFSNIYPSFEARIDNLKNEKNFYKIVGASDWNDLNRIVDTKLYIKVIEELMVYLGGAIHSLADVGLRRKIRVHSKWMK